MKRRCILILLLLLTSTLWAETVVTTYVVTKQKERESTRFTLTEWLKIKERMKMMDVWLAMFGGVDKQVFSPELGIFYGQIDGQAKEVGISQSSNSTTADVNKLHFSTQNIKGQLWLTNLVSTTLGIRTLNVDFGLESSLSRGTVKVPALSLFEKDLQISSPSQNAKYFIRHNNLGLRVFGRNVQDSSLVFKYGNYTLQTPFSNFVENGTKQNLNGICMGGEIQLYLLNWLGLESNYWQFNQAKTEGVVASGKMLDYGLYVEISLIRLMGGIFKESWQFSKSSNKISDTKSGMYTGAKILL